MKFPTRYLAFVFILFFALSCGGGDDDQSPAADECANNPVVGIVESQTDANVGQHNGSVTVSVTGASGSYLYSINGGVDFQVSPIFFGLTAGNYTITVKADDDCTGIILVLIVESAGNSPSFRGDIEPIIIARCAISGCHVSGGAAPFSMESYAQIFARAADIKTRIHAGYHATRW